MINNAWRLCGHILLCKILFFFVLFFLAGSCKSEHSDSKIGKKSFFSVKETKE